MTVYRFAVDIEVDRDLEDIDRANKLLAEFAKGTIADLLIPEERDVQTSCDCHIHISNDDYACPDCRTHAVDGKA